MKIAMVNNNLGSGGAEKLIKDLTLNLKKKINIDLILLTKKNNFHDEFLRKEKINLIYISNKWDIYSPINIFKLYKIIKKYDIVHVHIFPAQYWISLAKYFLPKNLKLITTEHSTENRRRNKKIFYLIDKLIYSNFDKIISITKDVEINLKKWIKEDGEKFTIIENGVNLKELREVKLGKRSEINKKLKEEDILITMVGRFSKEKDQDTLIKALKHLPVKYKILFVGQGELENLKKELTKKMNLEERIIFLGLRKDVASILKMSDIFVLSSNWEGFGLAAVEAMALGIPTLVSDVDGLKNVVDNNELIFRKGNDIELAQKIEKIINDKEYYLKLSKYCKQRSEKYSIENTAEKYFDIYLKLMEDDYNRYNN